MHGTVPRIPICLRGVVLS